MRVYIRSAILTLFIILFTACEPATLSSKTSSVSGTVVDGYISGASVCLDINKNGICDTNEVTTTTLPDGSFSFSEAEFDGERFIQIISSGGTDTATNKSFDAELTYILDTHSSTQGLMITPLTDLVAVSFILSSAKDESSLNSSKKNIADEYKISVNDLQKDPMQSVSLFAKAQEVQQMKALINTTLVKAAGENLSNEERYDINKKVKKAISAQIIDSQENDLNIYRVIDTLSIELNVNIPDNERSFVIAQISETKNTLESLQSDNSVEVKNLSIFQAILESEQEAAHTMLKSTDDNYPINVVSINISNELLTTSIFDTKDALLDEQACMLGNNYNLISDNALNSGRVSDEVNGITINSDYSSSARSSEVKLFYPDLQEQKSGDNTILFFDDYYFAFDQAMVNNSNNIVYIQTPKDENDLYGCYRFELDSTVPSEIKAQKVYRYSNEYPSSVDARTDSKESSTNTAATNTSPTNTPTISYANTNVEEPVLDKANALYDEKACGYAGYGSISDDSIKIEGSFDTQNSLEVISYYPSYLTQQHSKVTLYYPLLTKSKTGVISKISTELYEFNFDQSWVVNSNNTLYVKTPVDTQNRQACYRFDLNSVHSDEITVTKVYK